MIYFGCTDKHYLSTTRTVIFILDTSCPEEYEDIRERLKELPEVKGGSNS